MFQMNFWSKPNAIKINKRRGTLSPTHNCTKRSSKLVINEIFVLKCFMSLFFIISVTGCYHFIISIFVKSPESNHRLRGNVGDGVIANETAYMENYPYRFNSTLDMENYRAMGGGRFIEWKDGQSPYDINDQVKFASDQAARERKEHIKESMQHAWNGYKTYAFGYDEVMPVTGGKNLRWAGLGTTLVDSLDTLWLMNMKQEFYEARDWVRDELDFEKDKFISVFETTIRSLGGLLGAYDCSGDLTFLEKADDLGERLFHAFETPSGIPYGEVNLMSGHGRNENWLGKEVSLSAGTTLQLEFRYLAEATGKQEYARKAERVFDLMKSIEPDDGLYPATVVNKDPEPKFGRREPKISFGSRADSFYEYMLKIWLQGNRKENMYRDMYDKSIQGMHEKLLQKADDGSGLWYIAQSNYNKRRDYNFLNPSMDHLVCFMGGLLALGAYTDPNGLDSARAQRDLRTGKALTYTCYQMYASTATGLSPEIVSKWDSGPQPDRHALFYILRPEAVESFYILHQLTGDPIYREFGWEIYQSIEKYCKTQIAYGHYPDVTDTRREPEDNMESFFLGETMKYLYLLMDPETEIDIFTQIRIQHRGSPPSHIWSRVKRLNR